MNKTVPSQALVAWVIASAQHAPAIAITAVTPP